MNNKGRDILLIVAGGYLVYQGIQLVTSVLKEKPDNSIFFLIVGIVFIVFGGIYLAGRLMKVLKAPYEEALKTEEVIEEKEEVVEDTIEDVEKTEVETEIEEENHVVDEAE